MPKAHSKRYNSAVKVADLTKDYPLKEAVEILAKFPKAKFDETVELSFNLGVDAASGEQNVRGTTPLPNGSGKKVRVIVFTDDPAKALAAGADEAGLTELIPGGLRWVAEFSTQSGGTSVVTIPFNRLTPSVRATPVGLPLRFDAAGITRLQILHSKFGDIGGRNPGFRPGELRLLVRSIRAVP